MSTQQNVPIQNFEHCQTAHCESGAIVALLRHAGLPLSEPMAFGISGALTFAYLPFVKVGGMSLIAYRMPPGRVVKGLAERLSIKIKFERFRVEKKGKAALDAYLDQGRIVGLQTSVYWLPYFPQNMRFHFNAHNVVAVAHNGDNYLLSDPTFEEVKWVDSASLQRARFVKGMLAPRGLIYYPTNIPSNLDLSQAITKAIRGNVNMMLRTPLPFFGVTGIRMVARRIKRMAARSGDRRKQNCLLIGHIVRMQEEIGTGGAGFRFLYASFLQESAPILANDKLIDVSRMFTDVGDEWRRFALYSAKMLKGRMPLDYEKLAQQLYYVAELEEAAFKALGAVIGMKL